MQHMQQLVLILITLRLCKLAVLTKLSQSTPQTWHTAWALLFVTQKTLATHLVHG